MKLEADLEEAAIALPAHHAARFNSGLEDIRTALAECCAWLRRLGRDTEEISSIELLLAEVLTNIHEHAYEGQTDQPIALDVRLEPGRLQVSVEDQGIALPDGDLPIGEVADPAKSLLEQPEGGYGWFLIRALAREIEYVREGGTNRLNLAVLLGPTQG